MSWFVNCANCGKQVLIDGPEDKCYWCHKGARKKEDIMKKGVTHCEVCGEEIDNDGRHQCIKSAKLPPEEVADAEVPPRPQKKKKLYEYFEQNKEAILADYRSMTLKGLYSKWRLTATTWTNLKRKWEVQGKGKGTSSRPEKEKDATVDDALSEHEQYLILLGYQQATREFLEADKNRA